MQILLNIFLYGSIWLFGLSVISLIFCKKTKNFFTVEKLGLGFLFGNVLTSYFYFLMHSLLGLELNKQNFIFLISFLIFFSMFAMGKRFFFQFKKTNLFKVKNELFANKLSKILFYILLLAIGFSFFNNYYWPLTDWDALALYDFRAKVIASTGNLSQGVELGYFFHYPPHTSLLHTFNYILGLQEVKIWYSLLYATFLMVFYSLLRKEHSLKLSLFGTLILAISPRIFSHAKIAYTNLPYTIYLSLGYLYLYFWLKKGVIQDVIIGALLIAFSTWIRLSEPFWIVSVLILFIGAFRYKKQIPILILLVGIIFSMIWPWDKFVSIQYNKPLAKGLGISPRHLSKISLKELPKRTLEVTKYLKSNVYPVIKHYVPALIISFYFILQKKKWIKLLDYSLLILFLGLIYVGTIFFSFQYEEWREIPDSAARMSMVIIPFCIYPIISSDLWKTQKKKK